MPRIRRPKMAFLALLFRENSQQTCLQPDSGVDSTETCEARPHSPVLARGGGLKAWFVRQRLEHLAEAAAFAAVEVLGPGDNQVPMFPDEVGLFLLGLAVAGASALLGLARPTAATWAFALPTQLFAQPTQGIEDVLVDI